MGVWAPVEADRAQEGRLSSTGPEEGMCLTQTSRLRNLKEIKAKRASRELNTPDCDLGKVARLARW
jgi:hypothetical protein